MCKREQPISSSVQYNINTIRGMHGKIALGAILATLAVQLSLLWRVHYMNSAIA